MPLKPILSTSSFWLPSWWLLRALFASFSSTANQYPGICSMWKFSRRTDKNYIYFWSRDESNFRSLSRSCRKWKALFYVHGENFFFHTGAVAFAPYFYVETCLEFWVPFSDTSARPICITIIICPCIEILFVRLIGHTKRGNFPPYIVKETRQKKIE